MRIELLLLGIIVALLLIWGELRALRAHIRTVAKLIVPGASDHF